MQEMQASKSASQFVQGLDYPIAKADILSAARATSVGPTIQESLDKIPDREYVDAEELTRELSAAS